MSTLESRLPARDVPEQIAPMVEFMSLFPAPWALCGGWAVDSWLGEETRDHGDVDIDVFVQDRRELCEHLRGWQAVAHELGTDGATSQVWNGGPLVLPAHLHCRPDTGDPPPDGVLKPEHGFALDLVPLGREPRWTSS